MSILVVGATGYIGEALLDRAKSATEAYGTSTKGGDGLIELNLLESESFESIPIWQDDTVIIAAAISAPDICANRPELARAVNVEGTSKLISRVIMRGANVIFFSSDTVYGEREAQFDESTCCSPVGDYAHMKREVEVKFFGNPAFKSLRISYVFSSKDKFTKYLCNCAIRGEIAEVFNPFYRSVVHRHDVVESAISLATRWHEFPQIAINVGGPQLVSRIEYSQLMKDIALPKLNFRSVSPSPDFFNSRPKVINMQSPLMNEILRRPTSTMRESIGLEFGSIGTK